MSILFWTIVFFVSLFAMVKGADWFLGSSERIGLAFGLSPFVIGIFIVGLGTSFPEIVSAIFAVIEGVSEFPVANAIGSNIANIFLVIGVSAVMARKLSVSKDLIDLDLPLLAISTSIVLVVLWDKSVNFIEAIVLLAVYGVYLWYTFSEPEVEEGMDFVPSRADRRHKEFLAGFRGMAGKAKDINLTEWSTLFGGVILLLLGARYLIDSVIWFSERFSIGVGVITILAVAVGTSLPELVVSVKAAKERKSEVALGNIFGSNVFNVLGVIGIPALFGTLTVDAVTFTVGLPFLVIATILFVITGISKKIHIWEGAMFLIFYILFIGKLFFLF